MQESVARLAVLHVLWCSMTSCKQALYDITRTSLHSVMPFQIQTSWWHPTHPTFMTGTQHSFSATGRNIAAPDTIHVHLPATRKRPHQFSASLAVHAVYLPTTRKQPPRFLTALQPMQVQLIVYDEIHYLRDKERGVVWEESIIMAPKTARFVFLSATIPNAREFAEWIAKTHRSPCHVVYTDYRPTPLQHYLFPAGANGLYMVVDEKGMRMVVSRNHSI